MDYIDTTDRLPPFEAKFEELVINIHKMQIKVLETANNKLFGNDVPFTNVWADLGVTGKPYQTDLIGETLLILKSQTNGSEKAIIITVTGIVNTIGDNKASAVFCKYLQYLFGWAKEYVENKSILEANGGLFTIPSFLYSKHHFEAYFKEFPESHYHSLSP